VTDQNGNDPKTPADVKTRAEMEEVAQHLANLHLGVIEQVGDFSKHLDELVKSGTLACDNKLERAFNELLNMVEQVEATADRQLDEAETMKLARAMAGIAAIALTILQLLGVAFVTPTQPDGGVIH
jgi:hypothetical protein